MLEMSKCLKFLNDNKIFYGDTKAENFCINRTNDFTDKNLDNIKNQNFRLWFKYAL